MDVKDSVLDLVGNTPMLRLHHIEKECHLSASLFAKVERDNPTGAIKDRIAKEMILDALKEKKITSSSLIIEPTSGNTGIGLAMVCASLGLKLIIYMPDNCSIERIKMMRAFGADVRLTPGKFGMKGAIEEANKLASANPNSFVPSQFSNPANPLAHYKTTGPEIYQQLDGNIDVFVASFGTGGTLSGIAKYLKEQNPHIYVVGLEPFSSPFISKGQTGPHKIQGIGAGFAPSTLNLKYVDEVLTIKDEDAYTYTSLLAKKEGLFCGISSGANLYGEILLAKRKVFLHKNIVTVLPDNGERYLSVEGLYV
jgi:cysteine synthase A